MCAFSSRFMSLYHPTNLAKAKEEAASHLQSRLSAFSFLMESGMLDKLSLYHGHSREIVKVMDTGKERAKQAYWKDSEMLVTFFHLEQLSS